MPNVTDPGRRLPISDLVHARAVADAERGEWLGALRQGYSTIADLITVAAKRDDHLLHRIRLTTALEAHFTGKDVAHPARAARAAVARCAHLCDVHPADVKRRPLTIGWLIDARVGRVRLHAFVEAVTAAESSTLAPPWKGFPLRPAPDRDGDG